MGDFNLHNKSIFVAGHKGMVGSSICRQLEKYQLETLVADKSVITHRSGLQGCYKQRQYE